VLVLSRGAPGTAARAATLAVALVGDRYVLGKSVMDITVQLAQVIGFATGGILVAGIGVSQGLLADAATFLASALLVRFGIRARPKPSTPGSEPDRWWPSLRAGAVLVATTPKLRALVAIACVAGFYVTVEGLAAPYAAELGGGPQALGLLLAASPAGAVVGMWIVSRWAPATRLRLLGPLAIGSCVPLTLCAPHPGLAVTVLLWFLSGAASAYHLPASAEFVRAVPDHRRGQAFGLAAAALKTSQGLGIVLVGVGAEYAVPSTVIAVTGGLGVLAAIAADLAWRRARREPSSVGSGTADPT
jgi:predicted MFS family arabinose efflux permease